MYSRDISSAGNCLLYNRNCLPYIYAHKKFPNGDNAEMVLSMSAGPVDSVAITPWKIVCTTLLTINTATS